MKKITKIIVLAALCLNFKEEVNAAVIITGIIPKYNAQQSQDTNKYKIRPLKIGDKIPEALWNISLQTVNHPSGKPYVSLKDYRNKLIILDFWATWCLPCIKSLNELDKLQQGFGEKITIVAITYEMADKVLPFFKDKGWKLPSVVGDTSIRQYFPHLSIPHQVIIKSSEVYAITRSSEINIPKISKLLSGEHQKFKYKKGINIDRFKSIIPYVDTTLVRKDFQSILTGYIDGIGNSGSARNEKLQEIHAFNMPVSLLYTTILRIFPNEIIFDLEDKHWYYKGNHKNYENLFSYQLIAPVDVTAEQVKRVALYNLNGYLNLNGRFEQKRVDCYILVDKKNKSKTDRTDSINLIEYPLPTVVDLLNFSVNWSPGLPRFLNESSYKGTISIKSADDFSKLKNDITRLNEFLASYNLQVQKSSRIVRAFIISEVNY